MKDAVVDKRTREEVTSDLQDELRQIGYDLKMIALQEARKRVRKMEIVMQLEMDK